MSASVEHMTDEKRYYFACLDLEGRRCLVVGGGKVGLEKAKGLLDCGAVVTVVAPQIEPELERLPVALAAQAVRDRRPRRERPRRRGDARPVGQPARLPGRRGAVDARQRRRHARPLQLHPARRLPARPDRAGGLDRRRLARAGEAAPRRARRAHRRRARRPCPAPARACGPGPGAITPPTPIGATTSRREWRSRCGDGPSRRRGARRPGPDHRAGTRPDPDLRRPRPRPAGVR